VREISGTVRGQTKFRLREEGKKGHISGIEGGLEAGGSGQGRGKYTMEKEKLRLV